MTQTIILNSLADFVAPTNPSLAALLRSYGGFCHGFSIVYSAMREVDKQHWWESALYAVATWDRRLESLERLIPLPQEEKRQTLENIFTRVLNYVVIYQSPESEVIEPFVADQKTYAEEKFFEISTLNAGIKRIQHTARASGYFSKSQLTRLLDEKMVTGKMIWVTGQRHTTSIWYDKIKKIWGIYDSNYDHTHYNHEAKCPSRIHREYSLSGLIDEITRIHSSTISIGAHSLDEKVPVSFPQYQAMITPEIFQEGGIHKIVRTTPSLLPYILNILRESKEKENIIERFSLLNEYHWTVWHLIARYAPRFLSDALRLVIGPKEITDTLKGLAVLAPNRWTVWHIIARYAPDALPDALRLVRDSKEIVDTFNAFAIPTSTGWTVWHLIETYSLQTLRPKDLAEILVLANKYNETGLESLLKFSPAFFPQIFRLITASALGEAMIIPAFQKVLSKDINLLIDRIEDFKKEEDRKKLANCLIKADVLHKAACAGEKELNKVIGILYSITDSTEIPTVLTYKGEEGWPVSHTLAVYRPDELSRMISLVMLNPKSIQRMIDFMGLQNNCQDTLLHTVACYVPHVLPLFLEQIATSPANIDNLVRILTHQDRNGWTLLQTIANDAPDQLLAVIELVRRADGGIDQIARALALKNKYGSSGLFTIALLVPASLPTILSLINRSTLAPDAIVEAMTTKNQVNGLTCLDVIMQYASITLPTIVRLMSEARENIQKIVDILALESIRGEPGLNFLVKYTPDQLLDLMRVLAQSKKATDKFVALALRLKFFDTILAHSHSLSIEILRLAVKAQKNIALLMETVRPYVRFETMYSLLMKENALHKIARYTPDKFSLAIEFFANHKSGYEGISQAFLQQEDDGYPLLQAIAYFASRHLLPLLVQLPNSKLCVESISQALILINTKGETGLHAVVRYTPEALPALLSKIDESKSGADHLARALAYQDRQGCTGLHVVAREMPEYLLAILNRLKESSIAPRLVAEAILIQDNNGNSPLHLIARYAPNAISKVFDIIEVSRGDIHKIGDALILRNNEEWTAFQMIARYVHHLEELLGYAKISKFMLEKIAEGLTLRNKDGESGFFTLMRYNKLPLQLVLPIIMQSENAANRLQYLLTMQNKEGITSLDLFLEGPFLRQSHFLIRPLIHEVLHYVMRKDLPAILKFIGEHGEGPDELALMCAKPRYGGFRVGFDSFVNFSGVPVVLDLLARSKEGGKWIIQSILDDNLETIIRYTETHADILRAAFSKSIRLRDLPTLEILQNKLKQVCKQQSSSCSRFFNRRPETLWEGFLKEVTSELVRLRSVIISEKCVSLRGFR